MNATAEAMGAERSLGDAEISLDNGTTAFMFLATALVQFMTPGLGFFYSGMIGSASVVQVVFQSFACLGVIFVMWVFCAFSLTFGEPMISIGGYNFLGWPSTYFMLRNVHIYEPLQRASTIVVKGFPGMLFMAYQGMFAVITPALISGAFVDRMRISTYLIFITLWILIVYAPLGFWNWGGGWMFQIGAWDFAGGMVVHESAGFSALGILLLLGRRAKPPRGVAQDPSPHSIPMVVLGTAMLWFGWFGFNGGSALTIGGLATIAFVNSQLAPAAGMVVWLLLDWIVKKKPTLMGACSGAIAGLVVITPGAGFMQPGMAMLTGVIAACFCFFCSVMVKEVFRIDDTCDTVGVHGMGGLIGTLLVGVLSDPPECQEAGTAPEWCANPGTVARSWEQFKIQAFCGVVAAIYSAIVSYFLAMVVCSFAGPMDTYEQQAEAKDALGFGEDAYRFPGIGMAVYDAESGSRMLEGSDEDDLSSDGALEEDMDESSQPPKSARVMVMAQEMYRR